MPIYRVRKAGYFMGRYFAEGVELNLYEKQAKYALLSGQLEAVGHATSEEHAVSKGRGQNVPPRSAFGERSTRRTVGGSVGVTKG